MRKTFKGILSMALSAAMVLSLGSVASMNDNTVASAEEADTTTGYSYNAYLGFQAPSPDGTDIGWEYRDKQEADLSSKDYNYLTQVNNSNTGAVDATISNANITADGEYTISISDLDLSAYKTLNMMYITTDIPLIMEGVTFSNIQVSIDGTVVHTFDTGVQKYDNTENYMIMVINNYQTKDDAVDTFDYTMPKKSMSITFDVSGIDFSKSYGTERIGLAKNKTFTDGNITYKVTKASTSTLDVVSNGTVSVASLSAAGKKATAVKVPDTVTYKNGDVTATYKVSKVAASAFKGASKLKTATLGKNIKSIAKDTFKNCKKLKTVKFNAKLSSVAKDSFKGCKTVKVTGTSAAANKKLLAKKNTSVKFK